MFLQSSTPSSVEVGNEDLCISIFHSYGLQSVPLPKSCCGQVLGNDTHGGSIQSCKLCGRSENILNMLLCDHCEEAFHVSCCNPRVILPIVEWFCHSCSKINCKMPQKNSFPSSVDVGKQDLCTSILDSYGPQNVPLSKSCGQVLGIDIHGGSIQSCKLCGHSENILNMLLCDHCEEAFHVSCCNPRVVLPIDEWFCQSCSKVICKRPQNNSFPSSAEVGKQDLCISKLESYGPQSAPLNKSCGQVLGIDNRGGSIQSCKLCGHSENILNMLLCDHCEEAFHVSCCNPRVVLPIDEWFCHSCSKIICKKSQNNSLLKSGTISPGIGIGPRKFELGPIAVTLKYPKPYMSKARIGKAFQAEVPVWAPQAEVQTDDGDSSYALLLGTTHSHCADPQLGSPVASRKRKQEFPS